jgi:hypothetical protein
MQSVAQERCTRYNIKFVSGFPGTLVSSTNKTNRHDITEKLLKVALNTITPYPVPQYNRLQDLSNWIYENSRK